MSEIRTCLSGLSGDRLPGRVATMTVVHIGGRHVIGLGPTRTAWQRRAIAAPGSTSERLRGGSHLGGDRAVALRRVAVERRLATAQLHQVAVGKVAAAILVQRAQRRLLASEQ